MKFKERTTHKIYSVATLFAQTNKYPHKQSQKRTKNMS